MGGWQVHVWVEGEEARAAAAILPGIECVVCDAWSGGPPHEVDGLPPDDRLLHLLDARFAALARHSEVLGQEAASLTGPLSAIDLVRQVVAGGLVEADDATTTVWSSGDVITSFNHFSSLSVANGRVYIGTYDGKLYCFGIDQKAAGTR